MWWPSFVSVLHDLWQFCLGRSNPAQLTPTLQALPAAASHTRDPQIKFTSGQTYDAKHPDTVAVRSWLATYDHHLISSGPLTVKEWLLYGVGFGRPQLSLIALHMTPIGRFHVTLKGQPGVLVTIEPQTKAVMEWYNGTSGQVAVVLQVTPEQTITIEQMTDDNTGTYLQQVLSKSNWVELRPTFTTWQ